MSKPEKSSFRDIKRKIPERYTDEPAGAAGSSSSAIPLLAHAEDYDEDARGHDEVLPGYNDEQEQDSDGNAPPPFTAYVPVVKKIKSVFGMGDTLTVSHDPHLNNDGEALYRYTTYPTVKFFSLWPTQICVCIYLPANPHCCAIYFVC